MAPWDLGALVDEVCKALIGSRAGGNAVWSLPGFRSWRRQPREAMGPVQQLGRGWGTLRPTCREKGFSPHGWCSWPAWDWRGDGSGGSEEAPDGYDSCFPGALEGRTALPASGPDVLAALEILGEMAIELGGERLVQDGEHDLFVVV